MNYIDIIVVTNTDDSQIDVALLPVNIQKELEDSGLNVRSVTVLNNNTGLTGSVRSDKIQHKIMRETDR